MISIGIIANPASGRDIRRLVARGAVFSNSEKVNIVQRVLVGAASAGVEQVYFMEDYFHIGRRALHGLSGTCHLPLKCTWLDMETEGRQEDSARAASMMRELEVGCLVTLGGDGTNRVVAKESGSVPILPISTGTNNVFPYMIEGTVAGMAAGFLSSGRVNGDRATFQAKILEVIRDGERMETALVDAVVYESSFIGAKAMWEVSRVKQVAATWCDVGSIGMTSIGGAIQPVGRRDPEGLYLELGGDGMGVLAPIAPGMIEMVRVKSFRKLEIGSSILVTHAPSVIGVDGEREMEVREGEEVLIRLSSEGPVVVDVIETLREAAALRLFHSTDGWPPDLPSHPDSDL